MTEFCGKWEKPAVCRGKKMQEAIDVVENWANQWGFCLSVAKNPGNMFFKKEDS